MKKALTSLTSLSLFCLLAAAPANAASNDHEIKSNKETPRVIYQAKEEKDINKLYKKAVNGVSDISVLDPLHNRAKWKLTPENKSAKAKNTDIDQYETAQILKVEKVGDTEVRNIAVTSFADVGIESISGSQNGSKWDPSYSVKAYSTMYYTQTVKSDGLTYAKVTRGKGGWTNSDPQVYISSKKVILGTTGWPAGTQTSTHYPSGSTFDYSVSFDYVALSAGHAIGVTSSCTLKDTSDTWSLKLNNNLP
ncbi:hypothetical protein WD019_19040 [Fictibacillus sp. Mic-4]|uniref:hypothetical protein n=1 Tax=Fictibacillus TaxID=1329200 RepID=UPI00041CA2A9|nr:hypothetical protein [Fictibacillus gelatini]HAJ3957195.1 hypothetical protein [Escherichia coli]